MSIQVGKTIIHAVIISGQNPYSCASCPLMDEVGELYDYPPFKYDHWCFTGRNVDKYVKAGTKPKWCPFVKLDRNNLIQILKDNKL
jgi:hypothetical protein